jgi:hypothetical protein
MPIGAVIGGAVIGAGGAIVSGGQVAEKNNALYREIYDKNTGLAMPFYNNGLAAGNALSSLLLGTSSRAPAPATPATPTPAPATGGSGSLAAYSPMVASAAPAGGQGALAAVGAPEFEPFEGGTVGTAAGLNRYSTPGLTRPAYVQAALDRAQATRDRLNGTPPATTPTPGTGTPTPTPGTGTGAGSSPGTATDAWEQFREGTNYQWRLGEGLGALESNWAAHGALDSGAASKAIVEYGQNFASNELGRYMDLLASQQAMGLSAAGAVMGVGTSYAGNVAGQNTNAANAAANAALISGQANAGMWGSVGNAAGQIGGALTQYGMGQMSQPAPVASGGYNITPTAQVPYWQGQGF